MNEQIREVGNTIIENWKTKNLKFERHENREQKKSEKLEKNKKWGRGYLESREKKMEILKNHKKTVQFQKLKIYGNQNNSINKRTKNQQKLE